MGTATTLDELLAAVEEHAPDARPHRHPDAAHEHRPRASTRREAHPRRRIRSIGVVVLSQFVEEDYAYELLKDGAGGLGYLLKERVADVDELVRALEGGRPRRLGPRSRRSSRRWSSAKDRMAHSPLAQLTDREREVLSHMAQGENNAAIAESLFLTERAVEKHINSLFHKLGLTEETRRAPPRDGGARVPPRDRPRLTCDATAAHWAARVSTMNTEHGAWRSTRFGTLSRTRHHDAVGPAVARRTIVSTRSSFGHRHQTRSAGSPDSAQLRTVIAGNRRSSPAR